MTPALVRARAWAVDHLLRARDLARRHPVRTALLPPALLLAYVLVLIPFTPSISDLRKARSEVPTVVLSSDGIVLAEFKRINREWVPLDKISKPVIDALIATEDRRFYEHHGIDFRRTGAAVLNTLRGRREGGSTITQQLARNLYPNEIGRSLSLTRKAKEAITALKIEAIYSKDEILETYLNTVPFLYNAFGIEMAARTYFDKSADKLDVLESATLIGMLKGTAYYNPVLNPERARDRRNTVLAQMAKYGKLDPKRADQLATRPLRLDFERQDQQVGLAPHAAQQIRKWLIAWADREDYDIYADGLVVRTTIDSRLQKAANAAVTRQVQQLQNLADRSRRKGEERQLLSAGFLAVDPRSNEVKAWVGSADFTQDQFDHVNQARRQPGSTFKPFVYGAAFAHGLSPQDTLVDEIVTYRDKGGAPWTPRDATPPTGQPMTLREGLAQSRNTITAQVMAKVGPQKVGELAFNLGVRDSKLELVPSLALGTSPVTLREMVTAYGTLANNGRYLGEPTLVSRVDDRQGHTLLLFTRPKGMEVLPKPQALQIVDTMRAVIDEGTGTAIRTRWGIQADVAGKTGTTQDNTDGWFILMHPQMVAGAWVGYNDNRATMGDGWGQGARSALPIVGDFFVQALRTRAVDARVEFDLPRPRPKPREQPQDPVQDLVNDILGRLMRMIQ
ncbi:transglycosylase domain-containing protein [Ramlibacter sp. USB13]|uniref:Transglycosylase domain-containing protein n=1 Tax=Ramlibacter cellulosilyticus TaxID=2764187 RepID=A0A923MS95_9BURK|nr:transglycosylase domain-containing protein [Ramlibacter cellulosilyticus]MBC5783259.1 transglycosylase domain-containing protein [Ramlibacter cellulosilyticus]